MDFKSAMETFAEAWVAANTKQEPNNFNAQSEPLELTTRERGERGEDANPGSPGPSPATPPQVPPYDEANSGRSLPVHCVVETVWTVVGGGETGPPSLEVDSFVIIPVSTPIDDLVSTSLLRLGYSKEVAATAKGSVVIRNWRPLPADKIAESPLMTVGDVLGDLTRLTTLKIQIFRSRPSVTEDMKDRLLKLLLLHHHNSFPSGPSSPLDDALIAHLVRSTNGLNEEPSEEMRRKFEAWYAMQQVRLSRPHPPWYSPPPPPPQQKPAQDQGVHPALQMVQNQHPTPKTRMRTSFDPELELPKLQQWFMENQHPSRQQIQQFVRELNSLESRRGRKPLDVNNVVYWFKNARAAQKRAEIRNLPPALQYKLMLNGYHSNSQSPSEAGVAKSPASLNQDSAETLEPLLSPQSSPQPQPPKSPGDNNHDGSGEEGGENQSQAQDSISDVTNSNSNNNNNSGVEKEEPGDMSQDEDDEEDEEYDKDYKMVVKSEGGGGSGGGGPRGPGFPVVPNSMFSHSIMYMSHYFPGLSPSPGSISSLADERRKRNRTFIDPVSEVPRLEQWFSVNTHPSHALILKYTDDLNQMPYRQKFPPLEPKNVQFWFKNRRAKCKRLKMSLFDPSSNSYLQPSYPHHIPSSLSGEPYQAH